MTIRRPNTLPPRGRNSHLCGISVFIVTLHNQLRFLQKLHVFMLFWMPTVLVGSSGLETYGRLILSWFLGASLPGQPLAYPEVVLPLVLSARGLIIEDDCTGSQTGQNEFAARISRPV